jgi:hypothetical protein
MYWLISILGLALIVAPFVLGYSGETNPMWTSVILGAIVFLVSAYKALAQDKAKWEAWMAVLAGVLAVIAPWALGFSAVNTAMWTSVILGVVVVILAGSQVVARSETW